MSFWRRLFGRRDEALEGARAALLQGKGAEAWGLALRARGPDAWRIASRAARTLGRIELATRLDRAADDPADTERLADLAGALARAGELEGAILVLEEALAQAPFDAVLRSEIAILLARAARPAESAAALALHPCLADDPGALFQFAWSSLLAGDVRAARDCLPELARHRAAASLTRTLERALARAGAVPAPRDLRDWLFVEHGALLLDAGSPRLCAEPMEIARDSAAEIAAVLRALGERPARVIAAGEPSLESARLLASALGAELVATPRAGIPAGLVVANDARALEPLAAHTAGAAAIRTLAWILPIEGGAPVPDLAGAIARRIEPGAAPIEPASDLVGYASARAELWRARERRAFVPDAPLAWPR